MLAQAPAHYPEAIDFYKKLYPSLVMATTDKRNVIDKNNVESFIAAQKAATAK